MISLAVEKGPVLALFTPATVKVYWVKGFRPVIRWVVALDGVVIVMSLVFPSPYWIVYLMIIPFLCETSICVHVSIRLVDITWLAVGTPGLPVGAEKEKYQICWYHNNMYIILDVICWHFTWLLLFLVVFFIVVYSFSITLFQMHTTVFIRLQKLRWNLNKKSRHRKTAASYWTKDTWQSVSKIWLVKVDRLNLRHKSWCMKDADFLNR